MQNSFGLRRVAPDEDFQPQFDPLGWTDAYRIGWFTVPHSADGLAIVAEPRPRAPVSPFSGRQINITKRPGMIPDHSGRGRPSGLVYEKLFPDPGSLVRVPFGPFAAELWSQLARPERMSPEERLDCLLQVYRVHLPVPIQRLRQVEAGAQNAQIDLYVLNDRKAQALGITHDSRNGDPGHSEVSMHVAEPGQSLWSLRLVFDPTNDVGKAARPAE